MTRMSDLLGTLFERRYAKARGRDDRPFGELCRALLDARDEVTGMELSRRILDRYDALSAEDRRAAFQHLAEEMDIDLDRLEERTRTYRNDRSAGAYKGLMAASEPSRQELARRLNRVPGATAKLVAMRADLLAMGDEAALLRVDLDLRHLFASWFNRGFLVLRPITWESPANVLEKIIAYEAVHAIGSWADLRRRLEPPDRRCFAFFHPAMPDEPLIFVEVALTRGVPSSIATLLAERREVETNPDTATFYSISNCQAGLAGISFGNSLIKQVIADLARERSDLNTFVTLSPIPGLMKWLAEVGHEARATEPAERRNWAAHYLLAVKRPSGGPACPVARFHLGNGAMIHDIHAAADPSPNGTAQSSGAMVNYRYDLDRLSRNLERYAADREVVASRRVQAMSRQAEAKLDAGETSA